MTQTKNEKIVNKTFVFSLFLYFIVPVKLTPIGFSLHVLLFLVLGFYCLTKIKKFDFIDLSLSLFLFLFFLSLIFSGGEIITSSLNTWIISIIVFFVCKEFFNKVDKRMYYKGASLLLFLWGLISILQWIFGPAFYIPKYLGAPLVQIIPSGFTIYSSYSAITIAFLLIIVYAKLSLFRRIYFNNFYLISFLLGFIALYLSYSRAALGAYIVSIFSIHLFLKLKKFHLINFLKLNFLAIFCTFLLIIFVEPYSLKFDERYDLFDFNDVRSNLQQITKGYDRSINTRLVTFLTGTYAINQKPFFGIGLGQFSNFYEANHKKFTTLDIDIRKQITPHNSFIQIISELGIPVFISFIFFHIVLFHNLFKSYMSIFKVTIFCSFLSILFWLTFHDGFSMRLYWIVLGALASLTISSFKLNHKK